MRARWGCVGADLGAARKLRLCTLLSHLALIPVSPPPSSSLLSCLRLLPPPLSFHTSAGTARKSRRRSVHPCPTSPAPSASLSPSPHHVCRYSAEVEALLEPFVYEWTTERDGSISAEHGVRLGCVTGSGDRCQAEDSRGYRVKASPCIMECCPLAVGSSVPRSLIRGAGRMERVPVLRA